MVSKGSGSILIVGKVSDKALPADKRKNKSCARKKRGYNDRPKTEILIRKNYWHQACCRDHQERGCDRDTHPDFVDELSDVNRDQSRYCGVGAQNHADHPCRLAIVERIKGRNHTRGGEPAVQKSHEGDDLEDSYHFYMN